MGADVFTVLAEPTRRRILDELRTEERSVTTLVSTLGVSQPTVSKHLRVLRDAGLVSCRVAAQQRIYRVEAERLQRVDDWLAPYRTLWSTHLDALERHLDRRDDGDDAPHERHEPHDPRDPHAAPEPDEPQDRGTPARARRRAPGRTGTRAKET